MLNMVLTFIGLRLERYKEMIDRVSNRKGSSSKKLVDDGVDNITGIIVGKYGFSCKYIEHMYNGIMPSL